MLPLGLDLADKDLSPHLLINTAAEEVKAYTLLHLVGIREVAQTLVALLHLTEEEGPLVDVERDRR